MRRYAKNLFCVISRNIIKVNWPFLIRSRGNRLGVFHKIRVFENFAKLTRKHLCQSLFFNKVTGLKPVMLLKRRLCLSYCSVVLINFYQQFLLWNTTGGFVWKSTCQNISKNLISFYWETYFDVYGIFKTLLDIQAIL